MKSELKKVIQDWQKWKTEALLNLTERDLSLSFPPKKALALIGVRRCGKTSIALKMAEKLVRQEFLYLNFEDPFFIDHNNYKILDQALETYVELTQKYPKALVFDEIQNISGWERWARKFIDLEKCKLILTGSSAKMLSQELATALAGRVISKTIWPLSFQEFLSFKKIKTSHTEEQMAQLYQYLHWGGFPEVTLELTEDQKVDTLKQYFSDIVLKDVLSRNQIRNKKSLDQIINHYFINLSSHHSYTALRKAYHLSGELPSQYTQALQDAFLIFEVQRYHSNLKIQVRDSKKIYLIDAGLRNQNCRGPQEDSGKLLENAVYLELRRRNHDIFYFKKDQECDFVILDKKKPLAAIQVTDSNLMEMTLYKREVGGLLECLDSIGLKKGLIITKNRDEILTISGKTIQMVPAYQYFTTGVGLP